MKKRSGFTLIELLIVIGIIAILAGIVIIAVNPSKQFAQANNAQRQSDVKSILDAIGQYTVTSRGVLPAFITAATQATPALISSATTSGGQTGEAFCDLLVPTYISAMPSDPTAPSPSYAGGKAGYTNCAAFDSQYQVYTTSSGSGSRITVSVPTANEEDGTSISITR